MQLSRYHTAQAAGPHKPANLKGLALHPNGDRLESVQSNGYTTVQLFPLRRAERRGGDAETWGGGDAVAASLEWGAEWNSSPNPQIPAEPPEIFDDEPPW
jgi:hypothetical protein